MVSRGTAMTRCQPAPLPSGAAAPSGCLAQECRRSRPYREHQQQRDEGGKNQTEVPTDGQELQTIEPVGRVSHSAREGQIQSFPNQDMQFDPEPRWPDISWSRHVDMITGVEHERTENATDRLSEASTRILSGGGRIGKTAAPGWSPPQGMRGEAMDDKNRERGGYRDEYHHKQAVV